jgi:hypothetical protein
MDAELKHWVEWRERCALALCGAETRSCLPPYAQAKFVGYVERLAPCMSGMDPKAVLANAPDVWHLFETHITLGSGCGGKSLKRWLFARLAGADDPPLKIINGGVRVIIRDVVRKHIQGEAAKLREVSINAERSSSGDSAVRLLDLIPDPASLRDELELEEVRRLADQLSGDIFAELEHAPRVVLLAKRLALSLSDPAVLKLSGKGKSMLSRIWRSTIALVGEHIERHYADEDCDWKLILAAETIEALNSRIISWARVEKRCANLLLIGEN